MTNLEIGFASELCIFVPWAYQLAIIATINTVAHCFAEFLRNRALVLNSEVRNAAARIELVRCHDCLGRADIDALGTAATMLRSVAIER